MTIHRGRFSGSHAGDRSDETAYSRMTFAMVRKRALRHPETMVQLLSGQSFSQQRFSDAPTALWHTMLAEAYLLLGQSDAAFFEINAAIERYGIATDGPTGDALTGLLPVAAVWADLSIWVGDEDAVECCLVYQQLAERAGDQRRVLLAEALRAVAVCQHDDGDRGREQLGQIVCLYRAMHGDDLQARMLGEGLTAMTQGLTDGRYESAADPVCRLPALGGILHPDVDKPRRDYLASRIRQHLPRTPAGVS